jgi:hypothetical protein
MERSARTGMSRRSVAAHQCRGAAALLALSFLTGAGCVSRGNVDVLEARLRETQDSLRANERELSQVRNELELAQKETDQLRNRASTVGHKVIPAEHAQSLGRVSGLSINRLMSGGKDQDGDKQDEAIQVIVTPHDSEGDLVKIAGQLEIEAYDLTKSGDDKRIGRWMFEPGEVRKHWHAGFLSSGYQFHLPLDEAPGGKQLLVHARMLTTDGRQFDTNQTLAVATGPKDAAGRMTAETGRRSTRDDLDDEVTAAATVLRRPLSRPQLQNVGQASVEFEDPPARLTAVTADGERESGTVVVPDPMDLDLPAFSPNERSNGGASPFPKNIAPEVAKPFPMGLRQTSDNWTDDTLPRIR